MIDDLREQVFKCRQEIVALEQRMENAKADAKRLAAEGDMDGLVAVNDRFLSDKKELELRKVKLQGLKVLFSDHYRECRGQTDLELTLRRGKIWSGWGSCWSDDWIVTTRQHLDRVELDAICEVCGMNNLRTVEHGENPGVIRLSSTYYAYRNTCETDRSGKWLWSHLAPIRRGETTTPVFDLEVLK